MGLSWNARLIHSRALHQLKLATTCGESLTFNPEEILSKYDLKKLTRNKVCSVIKRQNDSELAYMFFDWAQQQRGYKHNGLVYGAIIHSLCRNKHFDLVEKVLMDLKKEKFSIREPTFTFILRCMGQEGKVHETLQLFRQMVEFQCQPTLSTYHCVLSMLIKADSLDDVVTVCQEMQDTNIVPDKLTLGMLTNGLCKGHRLDEALQLAKRAPQSIDSLTLNCLVRYLCGAKRPHDALMLVENSKVCDVHPDVRMYDALICSLCKLGKVDDSIKLLKNMSKEFLAPGIAACNAVLDHLCKMARVDEAWQLFQELPAEPDATSYNIIVKGLCKKRRVEKARKLMSEMADRAFMPTLETYSWISKGLIKSGKAEEACDLLLLLKGNGLVLDSRVLNEVIDRICNTERIDVAQTLLKQLNGPAGFFPDGHTYSAIINGFCKAKRFLEAIDFVMDDVLSSGWVSDITDWSPLFKGLCEEGCFDEMLKLYNTLLEQKVVPNKVTFNIVVSGLSKAGSVHGIKRVMREMEKNNILPDKKTYEALIDGDFQDTSGKAELFKPLIGSNIILTAEKYQVLIDSLIKSGEMEFAMKVFYEMQRVGCLLDIHIYNALIGGLCNLNKLSEARNFLQSMKEDGCIADSATYTMLLHGYQKAGQIDEVESLYREMQKGGIPPDAATYDILLEGFSQANRVQEVFRLLDEMRVRGCPPNDSTISLLYKMLNSREVKRVKKYVKELFGIVKIPATCGNKETVQEATRFGLLFKQSPAQTARKGKAGNKK